MKQQWKRPTAPPLSRLPMELGMSTQYLLDALPPSWHRGDTSQHQMSNPGGLEWTSCHSPSLRWSSEHPDPFFSFSGRMDALCFLFLFRCFCSFVLRAGFSGGCLWTARTFFAWLLLGTRISSYPALSSLYWFPLIMELTSKIFNFLKIYISISEIFNIFALPNPAAGPRF